ncbi:LysR family transcriptional regulator [Mesorhizobium sp. M0047]|uniref:LysR family transcriptional regulator n=1 Tax=Mesorhizobium sp. M0047 TaxID=2956859 RepID=UPI003335AF43
MRNVDMDCIRTFLAFCDTGDGKSAARTVNRTQSSVSIHLRRLEETIGRKLFRKDGRRLTLTPEGINFQRYARKIFIVQDEMFNFFSENAVAGKLRIGLPSDTISFLPDIGIDDFARDYPLVELEIMCDSTPSLRSMIRDQKIDVAIVSSESDDKQGMALESYPVSWIRGQSFDLHKHQCLPVAFYRDGCLLRRWGINSLKANGIDYRIVCSTNDTHVLNLMVTRGIAISVQTINNGIPENCVRLLPEDGFPKLPPICNSMIRTPEHSSLVDRFCNHVHKYRLTLLSSFDDAVLPTKSLFHDGTSTR